MIVICLIDIDTIKCLWLPYCMSGHLIILLQHIIRYLNLLISAHSFFDSKITITLLNYWCHDLYVKVRYGLIRVIIWIFPLFLMFMKFCYNGIVVLWKWSFGALLLLLSDPTLEYAKGLTGWLNEFFFDIFQW